MSVEQPWANIIGYWKRSGIDIRSGATPEEVGSFQRKHGVVLGRDVLEYFLAVDGSSDWAMDAEHYRFWPLAEVVPVHEALDAGDGKACSNRMSYPNCFVFADHLINSWMYAVRLSTDPKQSTEVYRVVPNGEVGRPISTSFRQFMESYASNPINIL